MGDLLNSLASDIAEFSGWFFLGKTVVGGVGGRPIFGGVLALEPAETVELEDRDPDDLDDLRVAGKMEEELGE